MKLTERELWLMRQAWEEAMETWDKTIKLEDWLYDEWDNLSVAEALVKDAPPPEYPYE